MAPISQELEPPANPGRFRFSLDEFSVTREESKAATNEQSLPTEAIAPSSRVESPLEPKAKVAKRARRTMKK